VRGLAEEVVMASKQLPLEDSHLDGEPFLEFQPAVDLSTGLLLGFEALVRWRHPKLGLIAPDVLLPWAERSGYMPTLSAWVFEEACAQAAQWPSGIQVAVNAAASELRSHHASAAASEALENSGLNPDRLTVEVTERIVADARATSDLDALARLGVPLAVDDVGTSWSTLENLRRFSITTAKIDREFISGLEPQEGMNRAIVEAIIHVSHSLAICTVAEGVETVSQVSTLREFDADVGQGYFFARPLPAEEALAMANASPRKVFSLGDERQGSLESLAI
jgi:EAL domain-containing protein (putative c-di-GMP-specific phosphodiesterase class I)